MKVRTEIMVPNIEFFGYQREGSWGGVDSASYGIRVAGFATLINTWGGELYVLASSSLV